MYGFVQKIANSTTHSSATTISTGNFTATVTPGNLIFAAAFFDDASDAASLTGLNITMTDTLGNTYQSLGPIDANNGNGDPSYRLHLFYAKNIAGGAANQVTANFGSSPSTDFYKGVLAAEYSGLDPTTPFHAGEFVGQAQASITSGTDHLTSGNTPTLSTQPCAVIGVSSVAHATPGPATAGTGFTGNGPFWDFGTGTNFALLEDKRVTATTAVAATFTPSAAGDPWLTAAVAFKEALVSAHLASNATNASTATGDFTTHGAAALAGNAVAAATISAALFNWSTVTLAGTLYTGVGGIFDPNGAWSAGAPTVGSVVWYDGTKMGILANGEVTGTTNHFTALAMWNNGGTWSQLVITVVPDIIAYANDAAVATGSLGTVTSLIASATSLAAAAGSLTTGVKLGAAGHDISTSTGNLLTAIRLAAAAVSSSAVVGGLAPVAASLTSHATDSSAVNGNLTSAITLVSAAVDIAIAAGALATKIQMAAASIDVSGASGDLSARNNTTLLGAAQSQAVATAALLTQISLASAAVDIMSASGSLLTQLHFLATAVDFSQAAGSLTTGVTLGAGSQSVAVATGILTTRGQIASAAVDVTTAVGSLSALIQMSGLAFANAASVGSLSTQIVLGGQAQSIAGGGGSLTASGSPIDIYHPDPWFVISHRRKGFTSRFPVCSPYDGRILSFDFSDELDANERLQGRIALIVVATAGVDPGLPGGLLNGTAAYDATLTEVEQPFHNGLDGCDYYFTVVAQTTNPNKVLTRYGLLSVRS